MSALDYASALSLLASYVLTLIGASAATGGILACVFQEKIPQAYRFPLGFALFPVLVSYGGLANLWRAVPFLSTIVAMAAFVYGIVVTVRCVRKINGTVIRRNWWIVAVPVGVILMLLITKFAYLMGGRSGGDETRSILFVSSFASNALKPAYPFDFSLPVAYPYYLFQTGAFLYHAASGVLLPSIALLATTLVAVGLSYRVLFLTVTHLFTERPDRKFFLAACMLTFSGFYGLKETFHLLPFIRLQAQPMSEYLHSGYHYLWGVALAVWGMALLGSYVREGGKTALLLAILLLCLSFGYSGISGIWAGFGAIVVVLHSLIEKPNRIVPLLRSVPATLAIVVFALLPQLFSVLPRFDEPFAFSLPHFWLLRDAQLFMTQNGSGAFSLWRLLLAGPLIILSNTGPFILAAMGMCLIAVTRRYTRDAEWERLFPLAVTVVVALFLLTFTTTVKTDWYSRGVLVPTIFGAIIGGKLFSPLFFHGKRLIAAAMTLLLGIQAVSALLEQTMHISHAPEFEVAREINETYPLGTIFYEPEFVYGTYVLTAGRAVVTKPPVAFISYIPHWDLLARLGKVQAYAPCLHSFYGSSTPDNQFVFMRKGGWTVEECPDGRR